MKFTFEDCLEKSKSCKSIQEFKDKYQNEYNYSVKKKWVYTKFKHFSKEFEYSKIKDIINKMSGYDSLKVFINEHPEYLVIVENHTWLNRLPMRLIKSVIFREDWNDYEKCKAVVDSSETLSNLQYNYGQSLLSAIYINSWSSLLEKYNIFEETSKYNEYWSNVCNCIRSYKLANCDIDVFKEYYPDGYRICQQRGVFDFLNKSLNDEYNTVEKVDVCLQNCKTYKDLVSDVELYKAAVYLDALDNYPQLKKYNGRYFWQIPGNCKLIMNDYKTYKEFYDEYTHGVESMKKSGLDYLLRQQYIEYDRERKEDEYLSDYNNVREIVYNNDYNTYTEFKNKYLKVLRFIRSNKWDDLLTYIKSKKVRDYNQLDCVYKYEFLIDNQKYIYIGRTVNRLGRDKQHVFCIKNDTVAKFAYLKHVAVPPMQIIEDNLSLKEGLIREDYWVNYYKNDTDYKVLNVAKTGISGSIGKMKVMFSKEDCIEAAMCCKTMSEFRKKYHRMWYIAKKYNFLDELDWFNYTGYFEWNDIDCVIKVAQKYKTVSELKSESPMCYYAATRIHNCLDKLNLIDDEFIDNEWNRDMCAVAAKFCNSVCEFQNIFPNAYQISEQNNWLVDFFTKTETWNKESFVEECKKYKNVNELLKNNRSCWKFGKDNNLFKEVFPKYGEYKWTFEEIVKLIEDNSLYTKDDLMNFDKTAADAMIKHQWTLYMPLIGTQDCINYWTEDDCIRECQEYSNITEVFNLSPVAYYFATDNKLTDKIEFKGSGYCYWSVEKVQKIIDEHNILFYHELKKYSRQAYDYIKDNNLENCFDLYTPDEYKKKTDVIVWNDELCLSEMKHFQTARLFLKYCPSGYEYARVNKLLDYYEDNVWDLKSIKQYISDNNIVYMTDLYQANSSIKNYIISHKLQKEIGLPYRKKGQDNIKWTFETIKQLIDDNNITYPCELRAISESAINVVKKNKWQDELGLKHKTTKDTTKWNYTFEEISIAAARCKNKTEFSRLYRPMYAYAKKNNLLDSLFENQKSEFTKDMLTDYKNVTELMTKNVRLYKWAKENNYLDVYTSNGRVWTIEKVKEIIINNDIKTATELKKISPAAYKAAHRYRWIDLLNLETRYKVPRTYSEEIIEETCDKYESREEFRKNAAVKYKFAEENGLLDKYFPKDNTCWTMDRVKELIKKYRFESIQDIKSFSSSLYNSILDNSWFSELNITDNSGITDEMFYEEAKKYNKRTDLLRNNSEYYIYGKLHCLIDIVYPEIKTRTSDWTIEKVKEVIENNNCQTINELNYVNHSAYVAAKNYGWLNELNLSKGKRYELWKKLMSDKQEDDI